MITKFTTDTHVIKRAIIPCKTVDGEEKEIHVTKTDDVFTVTHNRKNSVTVGGDSGDLFKNIFQTIHQEQQIHACVLEEIARVVLEMDE